MASDEAAGHTVRRDPCQLSFSGARDRSGGGRYGVSDSQEGRRAIITKLQSGYAHFRGGDYACKDCPTWITPENRCVLHGPKDEFLPLDTCNYNLYGKPNAFGKKPLSYITKDQSGFMRSKDGFSCKRCRHFSRAKMACNEVDKDSPGVDPGIIHPDACCNVWDPLGMGTGYRSARNK